MQIHKKVIGDIAAASIKEVPGAQLATFGIIGPIAEAFGYKNYPSVSVTVDKDHQVSLEIRVIISLWHEYSGCSPPDPGCDPARRGRSRGYQFKRDQCQCSSH